jgi:coenzyme PQQ precursor peptide PqqA
MRLSPRNPKRSQPLLLQILLSSRRKDDVMAWSTPVLIEICVGLEINGYLPAEL